MLRTGPTGASLRRLRRLGVEVELSHSLVSRNREHQAGRVLLGRLLRRYRQGNVFQARRMRFPIGQFSISHSRGHVVCAGCPTKRKVHLGVDIELGRGPDLAAAPLILSRREQRRLQDKQSLTPETLLRVWTVKEALFKADPKNHRVGWVGRYELRDPSALTGQAYLPKQQRRFHYHNIAVAGGSLSIAWLAKP